jgi:hypothetical protein
MGDKYYALYRHLSRLSRFASKSTHDDLGLVAAVPSIHRESEKSYSRKPSVAPVLLAQVLPERTPLHRTGYERYSLSFREPTFSETKGTQGRAGLRVANAASG